VKRKRSLAIASAAVLLALATAACGDSEEDEPAAAEGGEKIELKVGVIDSLTGPNSVYGIGQAAAAELAAKDINAGDTGVNVTVVGPYDSQSTPAGSLSATQRALGEDVNGLVGYELTEMGQAAAPVIGESVPVVFAGVTQLVDRTPNVFTLNAPSAPMMKVLVDDVITPQGAKRMGVIWQEQPTLSANADAIKEAAEAAGIEVVADEGASLTATDFNAQVTNVLAADPDVVSVQAVAAPSATIVSQLRRRGYEGLIVAQLGVGSPTFVKAAGDAADGVIFPTWWDVSTANAEGKRVYDEYVAAYPDNPPPDFSTMGGYQGVALLAAAAERAGSAEPEAISAELEKGGFSGVLGDDISFQDGVAQITPSIVEYSGGKTQPYEGG
jgi:branched-chain amino acid transport system substrate-binding protein